MVTKRERIDKLLEQSNNLQGNLGTDSTPEEKKQNKYKQYGLFNIIKMIDREFYKIICP